MANIKTRIEKLERIQPQGLKSLSDEELQTRFEELNAKPEIQAWLEDETDNDPLRLHAIKVIKQQGIAFNSINCR